MTQVHNPPPLCDEPFPDGVRQVEALAATTPKQAAHKGARVTGSTPAFLELLAPGAAGSECLIELEGPQGKLRIQWKGVTGAELAGFSRAMWESK